MGEAFCVMKTDGAYYMLLTDDLDIAGYPSVEDGVKSFEDEYARNHSRSYEASMSATIAWLTVQPSIVPWPGIAAMKLMVADDDAKSVGNVAIRFRGAKLKDDAGAKLWNEGVKPRLVAVV